MSAAESEILVAENLENLKRYGYVKFHATAEYFAARYKVLSSRMADLDFVAHHGYGCITQIVFLPSYKAELIRKLRTLREEASKRTESVATALQILSE